MFVWGMRKGVFSSAHSLMLRSLPPDVASAGANRFNKLSPMCGPGLSPRNTTLIKQIAQFEITTVVSELSWLRFK